MLEHSDKNVISL